MESTAYSTTPFPQIDYDLSAGRLCLDFANTANWHAAETPEELIPDYPHLLAWSRLAGLCNARQAEHLLQQAAYQPAEAIAIHARAIVLREAVYRLFSALSHEHEPDADDLATINRELAHAFDHLSVVEEGNGFGWEWRESDVLDQFLWPIVRSAADVLTSEDLSRVRECAGDPCGWLFLDTSRNRTRRWCSMASCGNRAKARRHYERTKSRVLNPVS